MRALLIICLFPFVEFCTDKGRTFCGDGQRLAATFAPLAASRACGCREKGRGEGLPAALHSVGKRRAVRWAVQRAAMADGACCAGLGSVLRFGVRKTPFPHWACLQPSLDVLAALPWHACSPVLGVLAAQSRRTCSLALACLTAVCIARGKLALDGLRAMGVILPETFLRSSFFPAKVKKTCPIVLCYARLALPLQK